MESASFPVKKSPHLLLATALSEAKEASREGIVKASALHRLTKARLVRAGCLTEILKGWYLLTAPGSDGSSTAWFSGFWSFVRVYLEDRFGPTGYCLSAESSLDRHTAESQVARQVTVLTQKDSNQTVELPHATSLFLYRDKHHFPTVLDRQHHLNLMPLPVALSRVSASYYQEKPVNVEMALRMLPSVSDLSRVLLETRALAAASRLAGAYGALGMTNARDHIIEDMAAAGERIKPVNPFLNHHASVKKARLISPYASRIEALWAKMKPDVEAHFPAPPGFSTVSSRIVQCIQELYAEDAYHSLSIEGYHVTEALINKIAGGRWDPEHEVDDRDHQNALAAKGYHLAFESLLHSIRKILSHATAGQVIETDLHAWYRALFSPLVEAGLLNPAVLAGVRNQPVYIRNSRHVPLPPHAVVDAMETFFTLLKEEPHAGVRAVLGHFVFVYIHPYMDGNGRIGRFLMNAMLISGGYNWTVIRSTERNAYMQTLEAASVDGNIVPFTQFLATELAHWNTRR